MRLRFAFVLVPALVASGAAGAYDPGPQPDVKKILVPQLDTLFPGTALYQGLTPIHPVPMHPELFELGPVRAAQLLAPASWIACLRIENKGQRRYYAMFFNATLLVQYRQALPPDRCEGDTYTLLRGKPLRK